MQNRDKLRTVLRKIVPRTVYNALASLADAYFVVSKEGRKTRQILYSSGDSEKTVCLKSLKHPIFFRPQTIDVDTLIQNVVREEYGMLPSSLRPQTIIDAGCYIGDTSCYFATRFPEARIISLEPNPDSFALASKNTQLYGSQITLLPVGLWHKPGFLKVKGESTGTYVVESHAADFDIEAISIERLLTQFSLSQIDILKIDIEGAEEPIFQSGIASWAPYVTLIIIEIHGPDREKIVLPELERHNFSITKYRSVYYCERQK